MSNRIGQFYDVNDSSKGIAAQSIIGVDEGAMSATALISTPTWDRQNDSLNPMGGSYENYRVNPVVFWDHGLDLSTPIAKSRDADGKLLVFPSEEGIRATSIFSSRNKASEQIFALLADDIVHAASIRFKPLRAPLRKSLGQRFDAWEMEEWSWTGLGVNPEAVREVISKSRLAGSAIDDSILKSLKASLPKSTTTKVTFSAPRMFTMPSEDSTTLTQPFGSQVLQALHSHMKSVARGMDLSMARMENPRVKELLDKAKAMMADITDALEGGHAEAYPDSEVKMCDKAKGEGADEGEENQDEEEVLKSFLASSLMERYKFAGLNEQLAGLASDDNLTPRQKSLLVDINNKFARMSREAYKAHEQQAAEDDAAESEQVAKLQSQVKSLSTSLEEANKIIERAIPHERQ